MAVGLLICDENQTPYDMQAAQGKQIFKTARRRAAECSQQNLFECSCLLVLTRSMLCNALLSRNPS